MEAGNYTVVTAGGCYTEYNEEDDEEELHCEDYGDYNLSLTNETGDLVGWVDEAIEEGLPSVSFIVGSLVLVGAAGLRRRIH